ncbi:SH2 domain-containing protein 4B isoform X2 [Brachyhypopomus gauderio]|uniref:SH2 domain-containing protein 4B isoform X2 n=1 Tax=Brachyhypopomus gauderio TaxID=698409 RepID=UPI004041C0B4
MMQQILRDMYVEPELLEELSEEQKHLLFYKIRQEQVRRWAEREGQEEEDRREEDRQEVPVGREGGRKNIQWLLGSDGEVWVWVMGEAAGDRPYEQIIRELIEDRARRQAQREAQELWHKKEVELRQMVRATVAKEKTRLIAGKWKEEAEDRKVAKQEEERIREELEKREEEERQRREEEVRYAEERRVRELYTSLEQERHVLQQPEEEEEWAEQRRRSKTADEEMKRKACWAREEHKRYATHTARPQLHCQPEMEAPPPTQPRPRPTLRPAAPPLYRRRQSRRPSAVVNQPLMDSPAWLRSPRPTSRESIRTWFCEDQKPKRAGYEQNSNSIAPWFHGIITREESELLLQNEAAGSFLVRVSEMIWGYALSYRADSGFKHFLIDAAGDLYSFLGVQQSCHTSLSELIDFHKVVIWWI